MSNSYLEAMKRRNIRKLITLLFAMGLLGLFFFGHLINNQIIEYQVKKGDLILSEKLEIMTKYKNTSAAIFNEHEYKAVYLDSSKKKVGLVVETPEKLKTIEEILILPGKYSSLSTENKELKDAVYIVITYYPTNDDTVESRGVAIYDDYYELVTVDGFKQEPLDQAEEAEIEKIVTTIRQDINVMFEEFVLQKYGCNYQVDCGK